MFPRGPIGTQLDKIASIVNTEIPALIEPVIGKPGKLIHMSLEEADAWAKSEAERLTKDALVKSQIVPHDALWRQETLQNLTKESLERSKAVIREEAGMRTGILTSQIGVAEKTAQAGAPMAVVSAGAIAAGAAGLAAGHVAGAIAGAKVATAGAAGTGAGAAAGATAAAGAAAGTAAGTAATGLTSAAVGSAVASHLRDVAVGFAGPAIAAGITRIFDIGGWMMNAMLVPVLGSLQERYPTSPIVAGQTVDAVRGVMGTAMSSLIGMTMMSEMMSPLKSVGLGYVSAMMADAAGFRPIISGVLSPFVRASITIPMMYAAFARLQPMVLDVTHTCNAWAMGYLKEGEFIQHLRWAGYPPAYDEYFKEYADKDLRIGEIVEARSRGYLDDVRFDRALRVAGMDFEWRDVWDELAKTALRYFALRAIATTGYYDQEIFERDMKRSGYPADVRPLLHKMYQSMSAESMRGLYLGVAMGRYRDGLTEVPQLEIELELLRAPAAQRGQYVIAGRLMRDTEIRRDAVKKISDARKRGRITLEQAQSLFARIGMDSEWIAGWITNERLIPPEDVGTTPQEEIRAYGRGTVIKRYKEGLIDNMDFRQEMTLLGYSSALIEQAFIIARLERDFDYAFEWKRTADQAYLVGVLNDEEYLEELALAGFGAEVTWLYLQQLRLKKLPRVKQKVEAS